jgi:two-component system, chemotaxis family, response regulator Rcp1
LVSLDFALRRVTIELPFCKSSAFFPTLSAEFRAANRATEVLRSEAMPIEILLVEDSESDVRVLREVLSEINGDVRLHVVRDGLEAIAFLTYQGPYLHVPRPHVILLDLKMPKMDGLEVLVRLKTDPWLQTIPIIVLAASGAEADIVRSYKLMANCYLVKPGELKEFEKLVRSLNEFWLTKVTLPTAERAAPPY